MSTAFAGVLLCFDSGHGVCDLLRETRRFCSAFPLWPQSMEKSICVMASVNISCRRLSSWARLRRDLFPKRGIFPHYLSYSSAVAGYIFSPPQAG